ncbi:MAG: type IV-A pilus assembly ATPase PilB [Candidatus Eisenbacteria bacterium]|nr:type IV-A pilus assembly ATPase PilB [Candidatus Eisenbacteria bacterium]
MRTLTQETLGKKLVEAGLVAREKLEEATQQRKSSGGSLTQNLVRVGAIAECELLNFIAANYNVRSLDLTPDIIEQAAVDLIPSEVATRFQLIPIRRTGRKLVVAMADPGNFFAIDDIKFITGCDVEPVVCNETQIKKAIDRFYGSSGGSLDDLVKGLTEELEIVERTEETDIGQLSEEEQAPIVRLANSLIADAVRRGASDIHIEPYENHFRVRFRIDGVLREVASPPFKSKSAVISRLKILSELDISEKRLPQDGRIGIRIAEKTVDLRVSTLPTVHGEKVVLRILDRSTLTVDLGRLGFPESGLQNFRQAIKSPYGMVLVTGPTGSGKTTTLYSALSFINTPEVNIMTAEDPVEFSMDGINQIQINEPIGLTFAAALRSFLRQDPNIIMVGEIRDGETGSIATRAALTGHLVLSTLHTNDAPSAVSRMIDMGIEPFLVAASTNLILAQRLLRKVCKSCKEEIKLHPETLEECGIEPEEEKDCHFMKGRGCSECDGSGYRGRTGAYEVLPVSPAVKDLILDRAPTSEIKKQAIAEGMKTLRVDGIEKLKMGITTAEEVLKETALDT